MKKSLTWLSAVAVLFVAKLAIADVVVPMNLTADSGVGQTVGTVTLSQTPYGLLLTPNLTGLIPGLHGFHIHQNPDCDKNGTAAGDHLDPAKTGKHLGPYNDKGHLGDLPGLYVNEDGAATVPVLAPRLKLEDVMNHSLMIHEHGDNYSDEPAKLGGGGPRMVCGVIK